MRAWETDLQDPAPSPEGGEDARGNALHVCLVVRHERVCDY